MLLTIKSFDNYLFRMAKNKSLDLLSRRRAARNLHLKYASTRDRTHTEPEQSLLYAEYQATAQKAIDTLSPKLRAVFLLSSQEELSLDEIADKLNLPKETVKKRLWLAGHSIKDYLRTHAEWVAILAACWFLTKT